MVISDGARRRSRKDAMARRRRDAQRETEALFFFLTVFSVIAFWPLFLTFSKYETTHLSLVELHLLPYDVQLRYLFKIDFLKWN